MRRSRSIPPLGLNRLLGRPVDASWNEVDWRGHLWQLQDEITPELIHLGIGQLHAQDVQNCLCEWDKFERVRLGEGKSKRKFDGNPPKGLF